MKFRLTFPVKSIEPKISYGQKVMVMGSCFAEEMGNRMIQDKMDVLLNPHGILYTPAALVHAMNTYLEGKIYGSSDLVERNGLWHSWDHHGRFSDVNPATVLSRINEQQNLAINYIKEADWLILTLGSSFIYSLKENYKPVANCHKFPAAQFDKRLLTLEEVITSLDNMMHRLFFQNAKVQILFTVSPVRYVKDGVVENNLSKAILIQAVHHLVNKFNRLHYFPSYELVIDDLRDYRFFKEDLVHPNDLALQYVWESFLEHTWDASSRELQQQLEAVRTAMQHKPLQPGSEDFKKFLSSYLSKVKVLKEKYPGLDLERELAYFGMADK